MPWADQNPNRHLEKNVFSVAGMTCENCIKHIQKELYEVPGVVRSEIDLNRAQAYVEYDPKLANPQAIMEAIRNAGYDVAVDEGEEWPFTH